MNYVSSSDEINIIRNQAAIIPSTSNNTFPKFPMKNVFLNWQKASYFASVKVFCIWYSSTNKSGKMTRGGALRNSSLNLA